ncbi:MAG: hypothetical protein EP321_05580 [Sphingomonadales bacterium]|nr:MAG: hypothetical protein EP345_01270 [Sphingomonadales bacterium]TNF04864.1 MAG: hypothetical protein EP321_05580 [Sphingomonadales bacterium]
MNWPTFCRAAGPRRCGPALLREGCGIGDHADALEALVPQWRSDIIHAYLPVLNAIAARRGARRNGMPMVYEIRACWKGRRATARTFVERDEYPPLWACLLKSV